MSKKIKVDLRLPESTLRVIEALAAQKILGETREEVIMHILRQHVHTNTIVNVTTKSK